VTDPTIAWRTLQVPRRTSGLSLALLTHSVPTSDAWRQTAPEAQDPGWPPAGEWHRVAPENAPRSNGCIDCTVEAGAATGAAHRGGTPSGGPRCPVRRGMGNNPELPSAATPPCRHRRVHPLAQHPPNILQLRGHPFADRLAVYREVPLFPAPPTDVSEAQKVEGLRLPFPTLLPAVGGIAPELDQSGFIRATPVRTSASVPALSRTTGPPRMARSGWFATPFLFAVAAQMTLHSLLHAYPDAIHAEACATRTTGAWTTAGNASCRWCAG